MNAAITSQHWNNVFRTKAEDKVSWFQAIPEAPIRLIEGAQLPKTAAIIDVGAGLSRLANELVARGYLDVNRIGHLRRGDGSPHRPDGPKRSSQAYRRGYYDVAPGSQLSALA